jgi:hypothetical protein
LCGEKSNLHVKDEGKTALAAQNSIIARQNRQKQGEGKNQTSHGECAKEDATELQRQNLPYAGNRCGTCLPFKHAIL